MRYFILGTTTKTTTDVPVCLKKLLVLLVMATEQKTALEDTWHHRYGHLGSRNLEKLLETIWLMALTMTHQEVLVSARLVLMESSIEVSFQPPEEREQKNHFTLSTVMFVVRFKHGHWVEVVIFLHLLMTALDMYGCTF